jgi:hypothetical protein
VDMSAYRADRPRRDILEEIRQQEKFYEYLFVSWGIIELEADQSILKAYGLSSQNPRAQPLLDLSIGKRLELFKKTGFLSKKGYDTVLKFVKKRNDLFHKGGLFIRALNDNEKEEIMDMALLAVDVMYSLFESINISVV